MRSTHHRCYDNKDYVITQEKLIIKEHVEVILSTSLTFRWRSFGSHKGRYLTQVLLSKYNPSALDYTMS